MAENVLALFDEFAGRRARGEQPDVRAYLDRAGQKADELGALLDRLLATTPPPKADPALVAAFEARLAGEPPLLSLRARRGLTRERVVEALVSTLGIDPTKSAKVKRYYHELETGLLEPRGVSRRLFAALENIFGRRVEDLVTWRPPPKPATSVAFLRVRDDVVLEAAAAAPVRRAEEWDEVDELFRGAGR
jgi:hypothetical protein